ncbi:alkylation response protein AidB-like acyl-CoA dehydrogenase [Murinocardiopsis flavida]|uniref:Alkylation response protein AidB-like acyl-CoA dehydrogenase n=1 Tax=Murinocardiopsis flavida TaxID=645275 RepID=A0A2P8DSS6_9ACTN|nr:acyl-CoA dehydrogenase family protein [Murinocardiopsis flavida]PSL00270.1 alkylation response protein AidB-like acyl-CoA dehydrogenase [Murinocardiopsis flavida]
MAFSLSAGQRDFAAWVRATAERELGSAPPPTGRVDRALVRRLGGLGLLAPLFPGAVEGRPTGQAAAMSLCLLREEIARVSTEAETALALQGLGTYPILQSGTEEQIARWVPAVAEGGAIAAFALSEPDAGSDAAALRLSADPAPGGGWRLNGQKTWISNAPDSDFAVVFARTGAEPGARGVSAFLVPADRPGLSGTPLDMLAPHALGTLDFDGVPVDASDLLGDVGRGFAVAMRTLDLFRPSVGAFAVGMAQAALDAAREHARTRHAFGGPLTEQQTVAHTLADMATRIEAARLLVRSAASAYDDGAEPRSVTAKAAMAKLFATETAQSVVDSAVQIHGARALQRGHLLEHLYRDVRATRIYEGASEVQLGIIARELLR